MNKTTKTVLEIALGVLIVVLAATLYMSMMKPVKFEREYDLRRDACAEKLKDIRTLEEVYKQAYGCYCGNFDTLFTRLMTEDSLRIILKEVQHHLIPEDVELEEMSELEQVKKGYLIRKETYVNPIAQLRESGKLTLTDEQIRNLRYVPFPKGKKYDFTIGAGKVESGGFVVPVFEVKVDLKDLLSDMDKQQVINKIAALEQINRYPGWKIGDLENPITEGNFE
ncbi:MAG: hypothetical protein IJU81_05160 [Bacteroidales bacterium]|nr:hypothetical protein [Bacteroidales bacterium]